MEHQALVTDGVSNHDRAPRHERERTVAAVRDEPARSAHGRLTVATVGAEAPAAVMPPQMVAAPLAGRSGGHRPDLRLAARRRAGAAPEVEIDVAPTTLAQLEPTATESAGLGAPRGQRRCEPDPPVARVDSALERNLGTGQQPHEPAASRPLDQNAASYGLHDHARTERRAEPVGEIGIDALVRLRSTAPGNVPRGATGARGQVPGSARSG